MMDSKDSVLCRRALRMAGWNVAVIIAGLILFSAVGETWLRLTKPFMEQSSTKLFVPEVGILYEPNSNVRWTNWIDFWTVSRANRLGFLDRELLPPKRATVSCHITLIGDSFVEAKEVPIADKVQVRLEALARQRLPHLDVTTSAFGFHGTGQVNQLPFYDAYARRLHSRLVVLVFHSNDFEDNSAVLMALTKRHDPDRMPWATAVRGMNGGFDLRLPESVNFESRLPLKLREALIYRAGRWVTQTFWIARWIEVKGRHMPILFRTRDRYERQRMRMARDLLSQRSGYTWLADANLDRYLSTWPFDWVFSEEDLPPVFAEAIAATGFALDEFKARTDRDGATLVILATHHGWDGHRLFDRMKALAEARGIPVINQHEYIVLQERRPADANYAHDGHWNPTGHMWAAEALFEWVERHPDICGPPARARASRPR